MSIQHNFNAAYERLQQGFERISLIYGGVQPKENEQGDAQHPIIHESGTDNHQSDDEDEDNDD